MAGWSRWMLAAVLCGISLTGGQAQSPAADTSRSAPLAQHPEMIARLQVLDLWIAERVTSLEQPSVSIGIVHEGDLIWARSYGLADRERRIRATPSTVYRIGSISKVFTALSAWRLTEADKLRIDDPVRDYLPWFEPENPFRDAGPVTIRHLLTHRSGLPFDAPGVLWNDYTLPARADVVAGFDDIELVFPPGSARYYSNLGYWIAGEVVRIVGEEPLDAHVDRQILRPLGMTDTDLSPSPDMSRLAVGYGPRPPGGQRSPWPFTDTSFYTAAGDGASTVEDMARLMTFLMGHGPPGRKKILEDSTLSQMWPPGEDGTIRIAHDGDGGGFYAGFEVVPSKGLGVVLLTNCDDGEPGPYIEQTLSMIGPGIEKALRGPVEIPDHPDWDRYLGAYAWNDWKAHVLIVAGELFLVDPTDEEPWESRMKLEPAGLHTFRMIEVPPRHGELMRFEVDPDGKVSGIRFPSSYLPKER